MKKAYYILILFFVSILNYAQNKHTVIKGETLYSISKKYNITPEDILKANPEVQNGVQENSILTIPKAAVIDLSTPNKHIIQPKDTKYSVSKKYGISIEELEKLNPEMGTEFEIGTEIRLKKGVVLTLPKSVKNISTR